MVPFRDGRAHRRATRGGGGTPRRPRRGVSPRRGRDASSTSPSPITKDWSAAAIGSQTTTFAFVTPARAFAVMPPAAVAGGGGVFAPGRGVSVFFQSATKKTAPARGGVSGCGYGGTSSRGAIVADAHAPARARTRVECLTAPDPFIEGFFPVLVEGPDAGGLGHGRGHGFGGAAPEFEYVAAPQIAAWQPDVAHVDGGALARITGADFLGGGGGGGDFSSAASFASLTCVFAAGPRIGGAVSGYAPSTRVAVAVSSALVVCETPSGLPEGIAALGVGLAGSAGAASSGAAARSRSSPRRRFRTCPRRSARRAAASSSRSRVDARTPRRAGTISPRASDPSRPSRFDRARARGARSSSPRRARAEERSFRSRGRPRTRSPSRRRRSRTEAPSSRRRRRPLPSPPPRGDAFASSPRAARCRRRSRRSRRTSRATKTRAGRGRIRRGAQLRAGRPRGDRVSEATTTLAPGSPRDSASSTSSIARARGRERGVSSAVAAANVLVSMPQVERRVSATIRWVHPRVSAPGAAEPSSTSPARFRRRRDGARLGEFAAATPGTSTVVVSSALIRLEATGAHHHDTRAPVEVSSSRDPSDAASWSSDGTLVAFHRVPSSHRAEPDFGGEEGGAACLLTGRDYRDGGSQLRCRFGAVVVTASAFSA